MSENNNAEKKLLIEENEKLKNAKICMICKDYRRCKLFLPCSHLTTCEYCCWACKRCPQCRSKIYGIVHVYIY